MDDGLTTLEANAASLEVALAGFPTPPPLHDLPPFTRAEIETFFRGGERDGDAYEHVLAWAHPPSGSLRQPFGRIYHA